MTTWVVMPAYNEAAVIGDTIASVKPYFENIIVVDDCSSDDTLSEALSAGATVCSHPLNLGQGAAIQTGIEFALTQGADAIVTFDSDGQHLARDAISMVDLLKRSKVDVVLASRFLGRTEGMTKARGRLLKAATLYTKLHTGLSLTDTHNGLRVLNKKAASTIRLRQNRMAHASEILKIIAENSLQYVEHPVTIRYSEYSKAKGQRTSGAIAVLADLFLRRLYR